MPFVKSNRTNLKAVTINQQKSAENGRKLLLQAESVGTRTGVKARCKNLDSDDPQKPYPTFFELQTKEEIKLTLQAAENFRIAGEQHWFDSANAYAKAASISAKVQKNPTISAELFSEAAFIMEKIDSDFASAFTAKAISQHCDANQYNKAAELEERMADNHSKKLSYDAAIEGYKRAAKLYASAKMSDNADEMCHRAAYLLGKVGGQIRESADLYLSLAISQANQSLKKFNVPSIMLRATVLLLSDCLKESSTEVDLSPVRKLIDDAYEIDCRFVESREDAFINDMMQCVLSGDLDRFSDCIFYFNSVCELDDLLLDALDVVKHAVMQRNDAKI
jgi:tetratricopeptide (TPR) repeat protein